MTANIHTITFLRHGESVGNAENLFQGHADFPLTENGHQQAQALAERWKVEDRSFDFCFSSPLQRARETAEILCAALVIPLKFDSDWMEINNGVIAGLNILDAEKMAPRPASITPYTHFGRTGESLWEVFLRAGHAIQHILDQAPGRYLVVSHGGILNLAMYAILGIPIQIDPTGPRFMFGNTTFATFTYETENNNWRLQHFDDRSHWKDKE
jgi:2,3-bisphosphoglycerate-dependent phosphoglycerate mutase